MTKSGPEISLLQDLAVLYELSLAVGSSIDLQANSKLFLRKLMVRRNYDGAALFLKREEASENGTCAMELVLQLPQFLGTDHDIAPNHPLRVHLDTKPYAALRAGDQRAIAAGESYSQRGQVAFRLGDVGMLVLFLPAEIDLPLSLHLSKLTQVMDKFAVSLVGCLDHERVVQAERRRREMEEQLFHAQKLKSLGVLAGGIAHDFNNLLTAILGNAQMIQLDPGSSDESVTNIVSASKTAAQLCNQLLAYSGRGRSSVDLIDLNKIVRDMKGLLGVTLSKRCILECQLNPEVPGVDGDSVQIQQVLLNLLTNASEAIGDECGKITIVTDLVTRSTQELERFWLNELDGGGEFVMVEVRDTGHGITEETLTKIFDPFFTTKFTGRGLGLAAVLGIVRSHGGGLEVISEEGRGTCFRVYFPPSNETIPSDSLEAQRRDFVLSGKVLLVDDEDGVRDVVGKVLQALGLEVLVAKDGGEGLSMFERHQEKLLAVLLDLTMPVMGGVEVFQEIRRQNDHVPVLLMSGYSEVQVSELSGVLSPSAFLQKPFDLKLLQETVVEVLEQ